MRPARTRVGPPGRRPSDAGSISRSLRPSSRTPRVARADASVAYSAPAGRRGQVDRDVAAQDQPPAPGRRSVGREVAPLPAHPRPYILGGRSSPRGRSRGSPRAGRCPAGSSGRARPSARAPGRACAARRRPSSPPTTRSAVLPPASSRGRSTSSSNANCSGSRNSAPCEIATERRNRRRASSSRAQVAREPVLARHLLAPARPLDLLVDVLTAEARQRQARDAHELRAHVGRCRAAPRVRRACRRSGRRRPPAPRRGRRAGRAR